MILVYLLLLFLALAVLLLGVFVLSYKQITDKRRPADEAWGRLDILLKKRHLMAMEKDFDESFIQKVLEKKYAKPTERSAVEKELSEKLGDDFGNINNEIAQTAKEYNKAAKEYNKTHQGFVFPVINKFFGFEKREEFVF